MAHMTNKLKAIIDGWSNLIVKPDIIEILAKQRADICSKCDSNHFNICIICRCPLPAKTRSKLTNCPDNKWDKIK